MSAVPTDSRHEDPSALSDPQRFPLPTAGNGHIRVYPRDACIHHLFEKQVRLTPDKEAVRCQGRALTYDQLNRRANRLAHRLQQLGVVPDELVGLCADRSLEMVVGILGILKSGGAYLPLDPTHPPERLATILSDSRTSILVTQPQCVGSIPFDVRHRLFLEEPDDISMMSTDDNAPPCQASSRHLAYVMYTSGSTGTPKGVCLEHQAVVNFLCAMQEWPGICASDRVLALTTVSFDMSVLDLILPLAIGAQAILASAAERLDATSLISLIDSENVSVLQATPSLWRELIATGWRGGQHIMAVSGGELMSDALARQLLPRFGSVWNLYGPTETTVYSTGTRLEPAADVTIGRPIANTRIYILDETQQPVPVGVTGEIYIGGEGLARGYWNRPELTAERFLPDPFDPTPGARMYRTGDLACWREDGEIQSLGRIDQQVKIRGFRIELEEIESVLEKHPNVAQCIVTVQTGETDEKQLVAFLVARDQEILAVHELRRWLAAKLPDYMLPAHYAALDALPLTPNGKLDRQALERLEIHLLPSHSEYVAPRNELESHLVQIWQDVLRQHEPIGIHDHFLDLGGHSLLAMRIVSQLHNRLAMHVPVRWVLEHPTIADLAEHIETAGGNLDSAETIPCVDRHAALPMSFGQQRFWILQETLADAATYNVPVVHRLTGPVDRDHLQTCVRRLSERHEALRTALVQDGDALRQEIVPADALTVPWREADWRGWTDEQREAALREEVRRPFDLTQAPLWRVLWSEVGPHEHLLVVTFHHCIVDEWSLRLFFRELEQLYAAGGSDEKAGLAALPVQYANYAVWQRARLTDERRATQEKYWAEQLRTLPSPLDLPADRPRPLRRSGRGGVHRFTLSGELAERLRRIARQEETSLFNLILASSFVWLYRHTGQSDMVVGTPASQRIRRELEPLMGFFLNTLPIRVTLNGADRFRELCTRVTQTVRMGLEHSDLPFEDIVALASRERDVSNSPLFEVMVVLMEEGVQPWTLGTATAAFEPQHTDTSKYDLLLTVLSEGPEWSCDLEFATDLFSPQRAEQLAHHWVELLRAIVNDLDAPVDQLNLLSVVEAEQIAGVSRRAVRDYRLDTCVHQLFEDQVGRTPQAEAIRCAGQSLTYDELNRRANRLAHRLRQLGVVPDELVGLCADRSLEMVVGILGILKAGAAYLPLDPAHPHERLAIVLADSQARVLVTQRHLADTVPANVPGRVFLDETLDKTDDDTNPACKMSSRHLAYVMYTSGSTGIPKGVCIEHHSVVNFLHAMQESLGIDALDRFLAVTTISFDMSLMELLLPLATGASAVIATDFERVDVDSLTALVETEQITVLQATPSLWRELMASGWPGNPRITALTAGEAFPVELAAQMRDGFGSIWNLYGPTETGYATATRINPDDELVTIGQPIANTRTYILDHQRRPVPIGVTGELYIGGEGVARGYWRRPELTGERFLPDPFDAAPNARMYRTGDLARWREDGDIEYLGRADQQVKIRGFRVELEEIEAVLETHPSVARCALIARARDGADQQLTALLVVGDETTAAEPQALRAWLSAKLPAYMVPASFAVLDALPLSPNGKIDRKQLANWHGDTLPIATDYLAPRTALEARLAQVWQDLFPLERIGIRDDFFALGGHSLLAVRAVARIQCETGIAVSLSAFLRNPTIERLAQTLAITGPRQSLSSAAAQAEPIPQADRQQNLPMSFGQQRFWILQQMLSDPVTYHMPVAYRIRGLVDVDRLKACLQTMLERHEALRTALLQQGNEFLQQIFPAESFALPWREADWRALTDEQREAALCEEVRRPFDLRQAPLWRALWSEVGPDEHLLALTFHHSIVDEWSLRVFFRELEQLYAANGNPAAAGLATLPVQYADYAVWQRERLTDERRQTDIAYWADQLQNPPPPLSLPVDLSRPEQRTDRGAVQQFTLPHEVMRNLRRLARAEGVSLFTLMLAAYQVWLYRYTGQNDVMVATPVADRDHDDLHGVFGYFLNTVPVRTRLAGQARFRETLARVHQIVMAALEHGDLPFEEIVNATPPSEVGNRTPLHQVMFVLLEEGIGSWQLGHGTTADGAVGSNEERGSRGAITNVVHSVHTGTSKCDLLLSIAPEGNQWVCEFEYATDLFTANNVQRMATHWQELLCSIASDPDQRIASLSLMPESERRQIVEAWNDTRRAYPREACVHELFETQAALTPEAVAVSCESQVLTYRELNQRANRLAHLLRQRQVDSGTCVGVYLGRSIEFVVSVLAILKAGGTYVPLAQDCPVERLRFKMSDSGCAAIITNTPLPVGLCDAHVAVIDLRREADAVQACSDQPVESQAKATDPAYVMYTSGSTGRPKGVAVPHRGIVRLVRNGDYVDFTASQRFLLLAPTSFDASTFELWGPLFHGNQCVIYPHPLPDLEDLEQAVRANEITCLWLTAGLFNKIIDQRPSVLESVQHVLTGGEALSVAHVTRALELFPHLRLTNGYGPTECTTFACTYEIDQSDTFPTGSVPIGRPIANTQCYVLDEQGSPVPVGVAGELYLGGDGLACGYLNLPELTAERFVADPFSDEPGARLYRTGDYVRYNADGLLEFLGRRDQQFKIRGFRVEIGEIEAMLETHPDIAASAVVVQETESDDKQLVAWLVLRHTAQLTGHDLRGWLETRLPHYMLPARYSVLDALPLTANGKVDRQALMARSGQPLESGVEYIAPRSDVERALVEIWRNVLRCESIGVNDHFFELGGNSLTAVQVIGRIQATLGVLVPVADLFAHPTLGRFAEQVIGHMAAGASHAADPGRPTDSSPPIFLLQWYLDLTDFRLDDRKCYVLPFPDISDAQEHCCVEYVASKCLETLRTVQPKGPYHLIGFSLAGLVAHEMTRRLRDAGEEVAFVAIIDTLPASLRQRMTIQLIALLGKLFRMPFPQQVAYTRRALAWCRSVARGVTNVMSFPVRCARRVVQAVSGRPSPTAADTVVQADGSMPKARITSGTENPIGGYSSWAYCAFAPRPAKGAMYLLSTEELVSQCSAPGQYWQGFVEKLEVRVVPGKHLTCIREHKPVLVETLRACLGDEISKIRKG